MANNISQTAAPQPSQKMKKVATISMWAMAIMIVTNIVSMRGLASQAEYGYTSIFYYVLAAVVFLLPYSLVCAELASAFPKSGGVFRWCSEAFGPRMGWTAMYLDWQMVVIWFPAVLMFSAVSLAFIFWPESFDEKLSKNIIYTLVVVLVVFWFSTFNTFRGMKSANKLSFLGGLFGTVIPAAILILLGIIYLVKGEPNAITPISAQHPFWPDFSNFGTIVLAGSIFLFFAGMEMQAVHISQMKDPSRNFPKSIFLAIVIILGVFIFGTLAIGFVIPQKDINLLSGLLLAYHDLWATLGCPWMGNVMAVLITFGVIGQVSVVIAAPSTGLLSVGRAGYLPRSLQKCNKNGIQTSILWVQGIFVTVLSLALVVLPNVQSAYQVLSQMSTVIYLVMVLMVYGAFLRLRRTEPNVKRAFKVPGGNFGKWFVSLLGIAGALLAMFISFVPPSQISTGSPVVYVLIVLLGSAFFIAVPFVVYARRKPWWRDKGAGFFPFNWQIEGRHPSAISKWPAGYEPTDQQIEDAAKADVEAILSPQQAAAKLVEDVALTEEAVEKARIAANQAEMAAQDAQKIASAVQTDVMDDENQLKMDKSEADSGNSDSSKK